MTYVRIPHLSFLGLVGLGLTVLPMSGCGATGTESDGLWYHETTTQAVVGKQYDSERLYPYVCTLVADFPERVGVPLPDGPVEIVAAGSTAAVGGITFISPATGVTAAHLYATWYGPWENLRVTCEPDVGYYLDPDFEGLLLSGTLYWLPGTDLSVFELDEPLDLPEYAHLPRERLADRVYGNGAELHLVMVGYGMSYNGPFPGDLGYRRYAKAGLLALTDQVIGITPNLVYNGDSGGPVCLAGSPKMLGWCCGWIWTGVEWSHGYLRIDQPGFFDFIHDPAEHGELVVESGGKYCPCDFYAWECCPEEEPW
jgi:hypothetical protein